MEQATLFVTGTETTVKTTSKVENKIKQTTKATNWAILVNLCNVHAYRYWIN